MRSIILVNGINDKDDIDNIEKALSGCGYKFEVNKEKSCVLVDGDGGDARIVSEYITRAGYIVL